MVTKLRRLRWAVHVVLVRVTKMCVKILIGKPETEKQHWRSRPKLNIL